jgi:hypothetical protein
MKKIVRILISKRMLERHEEQLIISHVLWSSFESFPDELRVD